VPSSSVCACSIIPALARKRERASLDSRGHAAEPPARRAAGFFLLHYAHLYRRHLQRLVAAWRAGRLHVALDPAPFRCAPPSGTASRTRMANVRVGSLHACLSVQGARCA